MHLFKEQHCGKAGTFMATSAGWYLLWVVWLVTNAQLEAEARVRKLEEETKLEKGIRMSITLLAFVS